MTFKHFWDTQHQEKIGKYFMHILCEPHCGFVCYCVLLNFCVTLIVVNATYLTYWILCSKFYQSLCIFFTLCLERYIFVVVILQAKVSWMQPIQTVFQKIFREKQHAKVRTRGVHSLLSSQLLWFKQTDSTHILKYLTAVRHASLSIFDLQYAVFYWSSNGWANQHIAYSI